MDLLVDVDGRTVAAHVVGARSSRVVVYHHGSTGGRLSVRLLHDAAVQADVALVGVDRPGYGLSAPSRFTFDSVAEDTAAVARAMDGDQVWLLGQSAGAAYALATAALRPGLVSGVALGGAAVPLVPGSSGWSRLSDDERTGLSLVGHDDDEAARLLALEDAEYALECQAATVDELVAEFLGARPAASEAAEDVARLRAVALKDGLRQGMAGWGRDNVVRMPAWDVPLDEIRCPATAWFGQDESELVERVAWLAENVAGLKAVVVPDTGHNVLVEHADEVVAQLVAAGP